MPAQPVAAVPGGAAAPTPWLAQVMLDTVGRTGARLGLVWIGAVAFFAVFGPFIANSHPYWMRTDDQPLVREFGATSSPLLRYLTGTDVTLVLSAIAAIVLYFNRSLRGRDKFYLLALVLLWVAVLAHWRPVVDSLNQFIEGRRTGNPRAPGWFGTSVRVIAVAASLALIVLIAWKAAVPARAKGIVLGALAALTVLLVIFPVDPPLLATYERYREAQAAGHVKSIVRAPIAFSPSDRLRDQFDIDKPHPWPPERLHLMGTDSFGADILSRMIHACRIAMAIGFIATGIAVVVGALIGGLMGYFVGKVDLIGMRLVEIFSSVPTLYLLLAFVAVFDRNLYLMMAIIGLTTWPSDARFVRAEFLRLRNLDFVHAAKAAGLPLRSVLFRHMLPNAMAPLLVSASFGIAAAILYESTLSFLGLGLVDEPSWGQMLSQATGAAGNFYWWLAVFPGGAIFLTVFAYNLIGEAVRDALDPKLKGIE